MLERKPYTAKSDIWSIGLMYYELLFGKAPWPHRNMESYLEYIKREPLRFPYDVKISSKSMDFIKRCLEIDENKRIGWNEIF